MSQYRAPGVYVVEDPITPMPVVGVVTGVPCFFGLCEHGPSRTLRRITSLNQFRVEFGGRPQDHTVFPHAYVEASVYAFFLNGGAECYVCRVNDGARAHWSVRSVEHVVDCSGLAGTADPAEAEPPAFGLTVRAISGGAWPNDLRLIVRPSAAGASFPSAWPTAWSKETNRASFELQIIEPVPPRNPGDPSTYRVLERYEGLSTDPADPMYFARDGVVNGVSLRIELAAYEKSKHDIMFTDGAPAAEEGVRVIAPSEPGGATLDHLGADEMPDASVYAACIAQLKDVRDVSLIACPDAYAAGASTPVADYEAIYRAAIDHAEAHRCLVVIDPPPLADPDAPVDLAKRAADLRVFVDRFRSSHAAVYAPWFEAPTLDPASSEKTTSVPPSGFILGAYVRSDNTVGVWKAPANIPVLGPVGMAVQFTEDESEILNPEGVNLTRTFPGQGMLIWGARTTSKDALWRYVNVRRLFLYVERTLRQQAEWAVFEPNDRRTWTKLINAASNFLRGLWRDGGLMGTTPEEAFFVQCGVPQTMTMTDVDQGVLKMQIGIAPVRPAEFMMLTLSQLVQTAGDKSG